MRRRSLVPLTDFEAGQADAAQSFKRSYIQLRAAYETECAVVDAAIGQARSLIELLISFAKKHNVEVEPEASQMRAAIAVLEKLS